MVPYARSPPSSLCTMLAVTGPFAAHNAASTSSSRPPHGRRPRPSVAFAMRRLRLALLTRACLGRGISHEDRPGPDARDRRARRWNSRRPHYVRMRSYQPRRARVMPQKCNSLRAGLRIGRAYRRLAATLRIGPAHRRLAATLRIGPAYRRLAATLRIGPAYRRLAATLRIGP